jgi:hypothetical protein
LDADGRQNLINGKVRLVCSNSSLADNLPSKAVIHEAGTGRKYDARFPSSGHCMYAFATMKSRAHTILCYVN